MDASARHFSDGHYDGGTVVSALEQRAEAGSETAIWLESLDAPTVSISCAELLERAQRVAGNLVARGVRPGDYVLIVLPTSEDFPTVFYGIIAARAVAVPLYPPAAHAQVPEFLRTVLRAQALTGSRSIVTTEFFAEVLRLSPDILVKLDILLPGDLNERGPGRLLRPLASDLALVQFSSGSTGDPKGICLSHGNIVSNIRAFQERMDVVPRRDVVVSWLPLYHDMGLIGTMIGSLITQIPLVLTSPGDFLRVPKFWFQLLSRYRATIAVAPQFAFNLCLQRVRPSELDGVDLSALRVLLDGAEPIRHEATIRFEETFSCIGLRPGVVTPCYGLAECTLAVAMGKYGERPQVRPLPGGSAGSAPQEVVSVGKPLAGTTIAIAGKDAGFASDGTVGEIMVRSPSVCQGQLTEKGIHALAEDGWLRTGDLGFLADGELHVSGRARDLIVSAGRNIYPHDLEQLIADVPGLRLGRVVAFAVAEDVLGTESVVVAAETRFSALDDHLRCTEEIRRRLLAGAHVVPQDVVLLSAGTIPRTSSGKLRRHQVKAAYEADNLTGIRYSLRRDMSTTGVPELSSPGES
jgi:acyl-CoA synthetase (AMP-forming)/AMP-acid ligase II